MAKQQAAKKLRKSQRKNVLSGVAHIRATFNNTIVTITDLSGNTVSWSSAGRLGFKGSRKSTPYAAQVVADQAARLAREHGMKTIDVRVQGPGSGRDSAIKSLHAVGFEIRSLVDVTGIAHNGTPLPGRRRV